MRKLIFIYILALLPFISNGQAGYAMMQFHSNNTAERPSPPPAPSYPTSNLEFGLIGTTNITQSSNAISDWDDINGSGRDMQQSTGTAKPTWNSSSIVQFDGSTDYMAGSYIPSSSNINFYCKFRSSDVNSASGVILFEAGDGSNNTLSIYIFGGAVTLATTSGGSGGGSVSTSPTLVNNTWYVLYATMDGSGNVSIQIDANSPGTGSVSVPGTFTTGIHAGVLYSGGSPSYFGVAFETKGYMWYGTQSAGDVTSTKTYVGGL